MLTILPERKAVLEISAKVTTFYNKNNNNQLTANTQNNESKAFFHTLVCSNNTS